jgi:hypothetical protein
VACLHFDSGIRQIVVQPFPDATRGKWQISPNGGVLPRWREDGRGLFYFDRNVSLNAVPVFTEPNFGVGQPKVLFQSSIVLAGVAQANSGSAYPYDITADGNRFSFLHPLRECNPSR